jgi:hypothetical protein
MTWTHFHDMHSGGGIKEEPFSHIFIEAPKGEAQSVFYARFGHSADRISCTCCGSDYSVSESKDPAQATGFERGCRDGWVFTDDGSRVPDGVEPVWVNANFTRAVDGCTVEFSYFEEESALRYQPYVTVEEYIAKPDVLLIHADQILPEERSVEVPETGWVWQD